jgi:hypothetical protein
MVLGVAHDSNAHALLRSDLNSVLFGETFTQAAEQVESELRLVAELEKEAEELGEDALAWEQQNQQQQPSSSGSGGAGTGAGAAAGSRFSLSRNNSTNSAVGSPVGSPAHSSSAGGNTPTGGSSSGSAKASRLARLSVNFPAALVKSHSASATLFSGSTGGGAGSPVPSPMSSPLNPRGSIAGGGGGGGTGGSAMRRSSLLKSKSITSLYGPRALSEQKVESLLRGSSSGSSSGGGGGVRGTIGGAGGIGGMGSIEEGEEEEAGERRSSVLQGGAVAAAEAAFALEHETDIQIETRVNGRRDVLTVNPLLGTMAGRLVASKNADKMESKLVDLFGGKKTKQRWYEVNAEYFCWSAGHDKEAEYKGSVPVSTITDIRTYTTDSNLSATNAHAFEFETPERVFALGCETAAEKENWVTALQTSRDSSIMLKGSYKSHARSLTAKDLTKFSAMFKKQGEVRLVCSVHCS